MCNSTTRNLILGNYNTSAYNTKNNELRLRLPQAIEIKNTEIALNSLIVYYSWFNVNASLYANNTFSIIFNGTTHNFTVPNGLYSISDLQGWLELQMSNLGLFMLDSFGEKVYFMRFDENPVYYSLTITCSVIAVPSGGTNPNSLTTGLTPQFVFNNVNFNKLIGFNVGTYPAAPAVSEFQKNSDFTPQLSPVSTINVRCSLVRNDNLNSVPQVIYSSAVTTSSGLLIEKNPSTLSYFPALDTMTTEIVCELVDQNNRDVPMNDVAGFTITLSLKTKN
jgi:hypothetical protein